MSDPVSRLNEIVEEQTRERITLLRREIAMTEDTRADFLQHVDSPDRRVALAYCDLKLAEKRFEIAQLENKQ